MIEFCSVHKVRSRWRSACRTIGWSICVVAICSSFSRRSIAADGDWPKETPERLRKLIETYRSSSSSRQELAMTAMTGLDWGLLDLSDQIAALKKIRRAVASTEGKIAAGDRAHTMCQRFYSKDLVRAYEQAARPAAELISELPKPIQLDDCQRVTTYMTGKREALRLLAINAAIAGRDDIRKRATSKWLAVVEAQAKAWDTVLAKPEQLGDQVFDFVLDARCLHGRMARNGRRELACIALEGTRPSGLEAIIPAWYPRRPEASKGTTVLLGWHPLNASWWSVLRELNRMAQHRATAKGDLRIAVVAPAAVARVAGRTPAGQAIMSLENATPSPEKAAQAIATSAENVLGMNPALVFGFGDADALEKVRSQYGLYNDHGLGIVVLDHDGRIRFATTMLWSRVLVTKVIERIEKD